MNKGVLYASTKEIIFIEKSLNQLKGYSEEAYSHSVRVGTLAAGLAREIGMVEDKVEQLRVCGLVHDIGKLMIPSEILLKNTALTPLEYKMVKKHTIEGYWMVKENLSDVVAKAVLLHHERLDGSGYPFGLYGSYIPLEARILMLADCYDAMTAKRCYKPAISSTDALNQLSTMSKRYDLELFDALKGIVRCG